MYYNYYYTRLLILIITYSLYFISFPLHSRRCYLWRWHCLPLESLRLNFDSQYIPPRYSYYEPPDLDLASLWLNSGIFKSPCLRDISLNQINEDIVLLPIMWSQLTHLSPIFSTSHRV